jgi:hypothetical protein
MELAHWLFVENRLVPWRDAGLPSGGWYLNSLRVPVPHGGCQCQYEIRRCRFIVSSDLHEDPAFALDSYN